MHCVCAVVAVCGKNYGKDDCNLQRYENVHFTDAGKQFCAIEVAHTVAPVSSDMHILKCLLVFILLHVLLAFFRSPEISEEKIHGTYLQLLAPKWLKLTPK